MTARSAPTKHRPAPKNPRVEPSDAAAVRKYPDTGYQAAANSAVANADHDYEESLLSFWNAKALFEKALGEE